MANRPPFHIPGASRHLLPDKEFHAEHVRIELRVDMAARRIAGSCTTRLTLLREGTRAVHLDACEMRVASVSVDGSAVEFEHDGAVIEAALPERITPGPHDLRVEYSAEPRQGVYFISPDEQFPEKPVQAWTQGEPEFSRFWYPNHDHPDDKSTSETVITVPEGNVVVSNGRLVAKTVEDGWATFHWREDVPHSTYLTSFAAGKFGVIEEEADGVPLQYYFPEPKREDARRLYGLTPEMLMTFQSLTGVKYPFEKYSQIAVHDFVVGGMENVSATTLTDTRFPDASSEADYAARYSRPDRNHIELVAHELAHMWFGDLVTARHWPHLWLNEGFATYFQALFTEAKYGPDEFRADIRAKAESYFEEDRTMYRRAVVDDTYVYADDVFDGFAYEKAALMIHELRYVLGDALFFRGVHKYLTRFARSNADTHDIMRVFEEESGLALDRFFEQAFFKAGHPELEVEFSWDEAAGAATIKVTQAQEVDEQTPIFVLPCDLVFYLRREGGGGLERVVKRVKVASKEERYTFELRAKPAFVEFDPEEWILKQLKFPRPLSMLLAQLAESRDASSRRRAAESLSSFKADPAVVDALAEAVRKEAEHHSVRSEAARALGKLGGGAALAALLGLVAVGHRRVRRAVVAALGEFKDAKTAGPLLSALRGDDSPYVRCEAALSYAKAGLKDSYEVVTSAIDTPSPENAVGEACLEALGRVKDPRSRGFLRERLSYGTPTRLRVGALKGLARLGWLEPEDVDALGELMRDDKEFTVRAQVLEVASELLDRRLLRAVREVAQRDPDPRARRRAMEVSLRLEGSQPIERELRELKDEVEKAESEAREFRDRFSGMKLA